VNANTAVKKL